MSEYAPPVPSQGPPPPKVPAGWKAVFNQQYQEWFYVNIYTKQSQWDKPTEPIYPPSEAEASVPPPGPPPSYNQGDAKPLGSEKTGLSSNNPYGSGYGGGGQSSHDISEDERLARQLQAEEDARAHGGNSPMPGGDSRGASDSYYTQPGGSSYSQQPPGYGQQAPGYGSQELPPRPDDKGKKAGGGFLGKLLGKASGSKPGGGSSYGQHAQPQYGGAGAGYPPQQGYYHGPPQGQYGYAPQQGYYGQGGGMPYGAVQQKPKKSGLGAGGAAALGVGGGLLGGMLLADAIDDHDYEQGYEQGYDDGNDFGGGDDFGGDF
ncbi:WW domain-containing protein WWM1 [Lasiodiplodia hormozganensis]|uniref:WW domain-containing protein WWM1 n=1 Tax=Lasiodiplodia hormozganensis TaxID=869390 RepID=A0AA39Z0R9_9PEZI|nr:WW domain-containing protein WWM1 [Lasiodiplodia hormozganensis]